MVKNTLFAKDINMGIKAEDHRIRDIYKLSYSAVIRE